MTVEFDESGAPDGSKRPRWETEIEEILAASDRESTPVEKARGKVTSVRYQAPETVRHRTSALRGGVPRGFWILLFFGLTVGAFGVRYFSPLLGRAMALAAVLILIGVVINALMKPSSTPGGEKLWRGRPVETFGPPEKSWKDRLFERNDERR